MMSRHVTQSTTRLRLARVAAVLGLAALSSTAWTMTGLPVAAEAATPAQLEGLSASSKSADADLITLNFHNIEIHALLRIMAEFTGLNIVVSDSVMGAVTLRLKEVPWQQALEIILASRGLGMLQSGNILHVAPSAELAQRKKADLLAQQALQVLEPTRTQEFRLNFAKAAEVSRSLMGGRVGGSGVSAGTTRILSPRGSVLSDVRTNQIFVTDIPLKLAQVQELIRQLDIPVRQVLIEARIVEASDTFGRSIGVRLGGRPITLNSGRNTQFGASYITPDLSSGAALVLGENYGATTGDFVNLPAAPQNGTASATFAVSLFNSSLTRLLNLEISALEADGKGKIISSPRIVTTDQVTAMIEQGTELPYQTGGTATTAPSIEWRKASLRLEVTPQITPEGNIILTLDVNKDSVGRVTVNGFAIDTKRIQTQVLVENGGTVAIGGIFEQTERNDDTKVPLLGDLPIVGALFRSRIRSTSKSEMLVFITPQLLPEGLPAPVQALGTEGWPGILNSP
ncbi:MAG: type IV pilus secretin PilQ [Polaromonas sp.]|nr:type IV pilus secretin PilQ [Polaromonas sp.]